MTIEIKKIVINIDGQELKLTVEQAKELRHVLDDLIENKMVYYPQFYHYYPSWLRYLSITWTSESNGTYVITADNQNVTYGTTILYDDEN